MKNKKINKILIIGIIIIAIGILLTTVMKEGAGGIILIAVGGLFFILGIKSNQADEINKKK